VFLVRVEPVRRLVEYQDGGIVDERLREASAVLIAFG
jgi:hypothetical protein